MALGLGRRKVALVLGNGGYKSPDALDSPPLDAREFARTLRELGFEVRPPPNVDLGGAAMETAIDDFIADMTAGPCEVGLFYYSGHGLQVDDQNYLVPLGFEQIIAPTEGDLVQVQSVIDRMSNCKTRLIFLDACRSSPGARALAHEIAKTNSLAKSALEGKSFEVGGVPEPTSGLARIDSRDNTYIAFAAAPGNVAYASDEGALSPFTNSLVQHLRAVDLPLEALMTRVHNDVFASTKERQSTWANSSLNSSFFFNPGAFLLITGNALALVALMASLAIYSLVMMDRFHWVRWTVAFALVLGAQATLLTGAQITYSRIRGFRRSDPRDLATHFWQSLNKGALGGYLGALVAAFPIGLTCWWVWTNAYAGGAFAGYDAPTSLGAVLLEFAATAAPVAVLFGSLTLFCSRTSISSWRLCFVSENEPMKNVARGALGGALAGAVAAPAIIRYFGALSRPEVTPTLLLPGVGIGIATIAFAIVNFDFESFGLRRRGAVLLSAIAAVFGGAVASIPIFGLLYLTGFVEILTSMLEDHFSSTSYVIFVGVAYGIPVGFLLGLVIALTSLLTDRFSQQRASSELK